MMPVELGLFSVPIRGYACFSENNLPFSFSSSFLSAWIWRMRAPLSIHASPVRKAHRAGLSRSHAALPARCHPALSQCMSVPVCCPLPCVSVTSQRTRLRRRAWKLSRENAEPKPLTHSSPNPEGRAPPEGKNRDLRLFQSLELSLCSHCISEENTFLLYLHYFES